MCSINKREQELFVRKVLFLYRFLLVDDKPPMKKGKDSCFSVMMILYGTYDFIMERCGYCVDMFHKTENKINGYCYFRNHCSYHCIRDYLF